MSRRLLVLSLGAALTLSACASGTLSAGKIATSAEDALEQEYGSRPDVSCPEELPREEGAETRCTLTSDESPAEVGVTVTVTSTDGDTRLGIEVDEEPKG